jgi:hypothetical protein
MFEALKGFASCDSNQGRSQDLSIGGANIDEVFKIVCLPKFKQYYI